MTPRHLPRRWLMTDERLGPDLVPIVRRLPRNVGIVFRHHVTPPGERRRLLRTLSKLRGNGQVVVRGGAGGIDGAGLPTHGRPGSLTWPAHNRAEAVRAVRMGARLVFVSPVFATRSHPDIRPLGPRRAAAIVRGLPVTAIALGGMTPRNFQQCKALGFHGWAAIDAWAADQKRKAVPR